MVSVDWGRESNLVYSVFCFVNLKTIFNFMSVSAWAATKHLKSQAQSKSYKQNLTSCEADQSQLGIFHLNTNITLNFGF